MTRNAKANENEQKEGEKYVNGVKEMQQGTVRDAVCIEGGSTRAALHSAKKKKNSRRGKRRNEKMKLEREGKLQ